MPCLIDAIDLFLEARRQLQKRRALAPLEARLRKDMTKAFRAQGRAFLRRFEALRDEFPVEEAIEDNDWLLYISQAEIDTIDLFTGPLDVAARGALAVGGDTALQELGMAAASFDLANPRAVDYLRRNGAARVTQIHQTTREELRRLITKATEEGMSYQRTAKAIRDQFDGFAGLKPQLHIRNRAELVAVTEVGNAYSEASLIVGQQLQDEGLQMEKSWLTMRDDRVSDGCQANENAGWIPFGDAFPSGHQRPLRFPGCRCDLLMRRVKRP